MRGYLDIPSPSLATLPNDTTQLAPFASLKFMPLFIFCVLFDFFFVCVSLWCSNLLHLYCFFFFCPLLFFPFLLLFLFFLSSFFPFLVFFFPLFFLFCSSFLFCSFIYLFIYFIGFFISFFHFFVLFFFQKLVRAKLGSDNLKPRECCASTS